MPDWPKRGPHRVATELLLADSDIAWTAPRNGFSTHCLGQLFGPGQRAGLVDQPRSPHARP